MLAQLNLIRSNPGAYGSSIGLDLSGVSPAPPLVFDNRLVEAARLHSQDMRDRNYEGHYGLDGSSPGDREAAAGYPWTTWEESIAWGQPTPQEALKELIIDDFEPDLGHRIHLLAMDGLARQQVQVGIGIAQGGYFGEYYTIDTGSSADGGSPVLDNSVVAKRLYHDLLGRDPAAAELPQWQYLPTNVISAGILGSAEYATHDRQQFITRAYHNILHRQPDTAGLNGWVNSSLNEQLIDVAFASSLEYTTSHSVVSDYIQNLYHDVLGRNGTKQEVDSWLAIVPGYSRLTVAGWFTQSPEAQHQRDKWFVAQTYEDILHRAGSDGEIASWLALNLSRNVMSQSFVLSNEYLNL